MEPQVNSELLMVKEAANYCRLSQSYLNTLRVSGAGPEFVKLGSAVRYRRRDLDSWIESRLTRSTSAACEAA